MTTIKRSGAWLLLAAVGLACGTTTANPAPSNGQNVQPATDSGDAPSDGSVETLEDGGVPGDASVDVPATWTPPTTSGPPATCTTLTKKFGDLSMIECVPEGGAGKTGMPVPLVIAFHGYTQSAASYRDTSEWGVLAGRYGFYVVFASAPGARAWDWFNSGRARDGADPKNIVAMVDYMKTTHDIREDMVFATGLSAGGYQAIVMLADYPDVFAAGAIAAGGPYGCAAGCAFSPTFPAGAVTAAFPSWWNDASKRKPRLLAMQGDQDPIVAPANLDAVVKQWLAATGTSTTPANAQLGVPAKLKNYPYEVYSKGQNVVNVAKLTLTGMGHATPIDPGTGVDQGGKAGSYADDVGLYGPFHMAKFLGIIP